MDCIFTPTKLAKALIAKATIKAPAVIADFAAGDGELLRLAEAKWPAARIVATDINPQCINRIQGGSKWLTHQYDFLRGCNGAGRELPFDVAKKCNLVLLNPPFSCRGSQVWTTKVGEFSLRTSISMAFVLRAVSCLAPNGQILAILPAGSLSSQKDYLAWKFVRSLCKCEILSTNGHRTFPSCSPHTVSVRCTARKEAVRFGLVPHRKAAKAQSCHNGVVTISRGNVDMSTLPARNRRKRELLLVHTTELKNHAILAFRKVKSLSRFRLFQGPTVLLPRVGTPRKDKMVLYESRRKIALSSCVLTMTCTDRNSANHLYVTLLNNWDSIESLYCGTGARYVTLDRLQNFLQKLGYDPKLAPCVLKQSSKMQEHESLIVPSLTSFHLFENQNGNLKTNRPTRGK